MVDIKFWEKKMQERRKQTPWREFVKEIASRQSLLFYKIHGILSQYPDTPRIGGVMEYSQYEPQTPELHIQGNFFDKLKEMFKKYHFPATTHYDNSENCTFSNIVVGSKNVYLSNTVTFGSENVVYCYNVKDGGKNILNSHNIYGGSQNIYQSNNILRSHNIFYAKHIIDSNNIRNSCNLISCEECINCNDLEHKKYHIDNRPYSKEEYLIQKQEILASERY